MQYGTEGKYEKQLSFQLLTQLLVFIRRLTLVFHAMKLLHIGKDRKSYDVLLCIINKHMPAIYAAVYPTR